jgi:thymidylate kinase
MLKVIWLEGLPGSGKSTVVDHIEKLFPENFLIFPKTDIVSIFVKGLKFNFNDYFIPEYDSAVAVEILKASLLNHCRRDDIKLVIGERSFVSSIVYYTVQHASNLMTMHDFHNMLNQFNDIQKNYSEDFIYIDCSPDQSLKRDTNRVTSFWTSYKNLSMIRKAYLDFFNTTQYHVIPDGCSIEELLKQSHEIIKGALR